MMMLQGSVSYKVGKTSGGDTRYFTDGNEVYEYLESMYRFDLEGAFKGQPNPIFKWDGSYLEFQDFCQKNKIVIQGPIKGGWFKAEITREWLENGFKEAKKRYEDWEWLKMFYERSKKCISRVVDAADDYRWHKYFESRTLSALDSMTGHEFELAINELYEKKGYATRLTPKTGDYGVDLIAVRSGEHLAIQAKRYSKPVGVKAIQEASAGAKYYGAKTPVVISNSTFTKNAIDLAKRLGVRLIDTKVLSSMWLEAFPVLDIPPFCPDVYKNLEKQIDAVVGRSLNSGEYDLLARLLASRELGVHLGAWVKDVYWYTNRPQRMFKIAKNLNFITKAEIDSSELKLQAPKIYQAYLEAPRGLKSNPDFNVAQSNNKKLEQALARIEREFSDEISTIEKQFKQRLEGAVVASNRYEQILAEKAHLLADVERRKNLAEIYARGWINGINWSYGRADDGSSFVIMNSSHETN